MNKALTVGILVLLGLGSSFFIPEELIEAGYQSYSCDNKTVMLCWKLSGGKHTRCYDYIDKYGWINCKSGWKLYEQEIIGEEIKFPIELKPYKQGYKNVTNKSILVTLDKKRKGDYNYVWVNYTYEVDGINMIKERRIRLESGTNLTEDIERIRQVIDNDILMATKIKPKEETVRKMKGIIMK